MPDPPMHKPCPSFSAAAAICIKFCCRNTNTCVCLTHLLTPAPCIARFTKLLSISGTTIHQRLHTLRQSSPAQSCHLIHRKMHATCKKKIDKRKLVSFAITEQGKCPHCASKCNCRMNSLASIGLTTVAKIVFRGCYRFL